MDGEVIISHASGYPPAHGFYNAKKHKKRTDQIGS